MLIVGAWGKVIHEKNLKQKVSWHCPFKEEGEEGFSTRSTTANEQNEQNFQTTELHPKKM